jgi:DNA polymerase-3 subunit beta
VFTCAESEYRILGLPPEEFPPLPEVQGHVALELPASALRKMIRQVSIAVDTDDTRPVLTGIHIRLSGGRLRMAATDLFRLAVRSCPVSSAAGPASGNVDRQPVSPVGEDAALDTTATIPGRAMAELLRALPEEGGGPVRVCLDASQARFATERVTLVSRLLAGRFPPFERLLPTGYTTRLLIPTGPFQQALRRAALVARGNSDRVMLRTGGARLTVTAQAGELGQAYEALEVAHEGEEFEIAINCRYLLDVLAVLNDEGLYLDLAGAQEAVAIRPVEDPDYLVLVMPQRLQ